MKTSLSTTICLFLIILFSCKKEDKTYRGNTQAEFPRTDITEKIPFNVTGTTSITIPLQIIGTAYNTDKTITLELLPANNIIYLENKTLTLSANQYSTSINIIINTDSCSEGVNYFSYLRITDSGEIKPSKNYDSCAIKLYKQPFIDMFLGKYSCEESASQLKYNTTFIAGTGNTIKNTNFWNFSPTDGYVIFTILKDVNRTINIEEQDWTDRKGMSYHISGSGNYDSNGKIIIQYKMLEAESDTLYESGTHIYTPIE